MKKFFVFAVAMCGALASIAQVNLNSGLVAYYPQNGNCNDLSGNGNHASITNCTSSPNRYGTPSSSFHLNGLTSQWVAPASASFTTIETNDAISVSAWIYITGFPQDWFSVMNKYHSVSDLGYSVQYYGPASFLEFSTENGSFNTTYTFSQNTWYHLVVTYSQALAQSRMYVNGTQIYAGSQSFAIPNTNGPMYVGYNPFGGDEYSSGHVDDLRIYNRALSAAEVSALNQPPPPTATGGTVCINSMGTITATGYNILWYSNPALTNQVGSGPSYNPPTNVAGTFTYYAVNVVDDQMSTGTPVTFIVSAPVVSTSTQTNVSCFGGSNGAASIGTPSGGPSFSAISNSRATSDYSQINAITTASYANGLTFEAWVRPNSTWLSGDGMVFAINSNTGTGNRFLLGYNPGFQQFVYFDDNLGNQFFTGTQPRGTWYHIAITISNTNVVSLYLNGNLNRTVNTNGGALAILPTDMASLGQEFDLGPTSQHFDGLIDEVRIWNTNLNAATILSNSNACPYLSPSHPNIANLVANYHCEEASGTVLNDASANLRHGARVAGSAWATNAQINYLCYAGGGFTYDWSPGNPIGDGTTSVTGLSQGTYTCTITNLSGCTSTVTFSITQPAAVAGTTIVTNTTCFNGSNGAIDLTPSGGTGPYTFSWTPSGQTTEDAAGLTQGTYSVVITDANTCSATVTATVTQPTMISVGPLGPDVSCFGGTTSIFIAATGGTGPLTGTGPQIVPAGTYTFVVTDANGCTGSATYIVTEPPQLIASTSTTSSITCNGGSNGNISAIISGGTPGYTYQWQPTGGTNATEVGLSAGCYTVIATDANGCTVTASTCLTEPTAISPNQMQNNITCNSGNNGHLMVSPSGGTGGYTYSWSPVASSFNVLNGSPAGFYTCTIADANGCTVTATFNLTEPTTFSVTTMQTDLLCNGAATGDAMVMVSGSNPGYTYAWSPLGGNNATASGLSAGTYSCTITDAVGCTTVSTVTLTEPSAISITGGVVPPTCFGGGDGAINIVTSGGTPGYTWLWSNMSTLESATSLTAGMYCVTVTDANGCTFSTCLTVTEPPQITSTASTTDPTGCTTNDGVIDLSVTGGTGLYTFAWSNAATSEDISSLDGGTYSVTITDANGCTHTNSYTVTEPGAPTVTYSEPNDTACTGVPFNTPPFVLSGESPSGGTWSGPGVVGNTYDALLANVGYNLITYTFTDAGGCSGSAIDSILVDICLSVDPIATNEISIFPNPSNGMFNIATPENSVLKVYDALGNVIISVRTANNKTEIDLSGFANGIYLLTVQNDESTSTHKLILNK